VAVSKISFERFCRKAKTLQTLQRWQRIAKCLFFCVCHSLLDVSYKIIRLMPPSESESGYALISLVEPETIFHRRIVCTSLQKTDSPHWLAYLSSHHATLYGTWLELRTLRMQCYNLKRFAPTQWGSAFDSNSYISERAALATFVGRKGLSAWRRKAIVELL